MTAEILAPLCAYTLMLMILWWSLGTVRILSAFRGTMPEEYLRIGQGPTPSTAVVTLHHHFSNHFEVPVLFYAAVLALLAIDAVDTWSVRLAWAFVVLRIVHTGIVLAGNVPQVRVFPYVLSGVAVWILWWQVFHAAVWPA